MGERRRNTVLPGVFPRLSPTARPHRLPSFAQHGISTKRRRARIACAVVGCLVVAIANSANDIANSMGMLENGKKTRKHMFWLSGTCDPVGR